MIKTGTGMVADSDYLELHEAGYTDASADECIDWCEKWADGKLYVSVGQNCWSMVHQFCEEYGLRVPESVECASLVC